MRRTRNSARGRAQTHRLAIHIDVLLRSCTYDEPIAAVNKSERERIVER